MISKTPLVAGPWSAARIFSVGAVLCALFLTGCATNVGDLPSPIALPAGTPDRPAAPYTYPAVHDMPPDRAAKPMTDEQQQRIEADLVAARARQGGPPAPKPAAATKKSKSGPQSTGGTPNP